MKYPMPTEGELANFYVRWDEWLSKSAALNSKTRGVYRRRVNAFFAEIFPDTPLRALLMISSARMDEEFRRYDRSDAAKGETWRSLRHLFDFAVEEAECASSPIVSDRYPGSQGGKEVADPELEAFFQRWLWHSKTGRGSATTRATSRRNAIRLMRYSGLPLQLDQLRNITVAVVSAYFKAEGPTVRSRRRDVWLDFYNLLEVARQQRLVVENPLADGWHLFEWDSDDHQSKGGSRTLSKGQLATVEEMISAQEMESWQIKQDLALICLFYRSMLRPIEVLSIRQEQDLTFSVEHIGKRRTALEIDAQTFKAVSRFLISLPFPLDRQKTLFRHPTSKHCGSLDQLLARWRKISVDGIHLTPGLLRVSRKEHMIADGVEVEAIAKVSRLKYADALVDGSQPSFEDLYARYGQFHPRYRTG